MSLPVQRAAGSFRILLLAALLFAVGCDLVVGPGSGEAGDASVLIEELPRSLAPAEVAVVEASNRFGFDLLRQLRAGEPGENLFLSPLSASMALGMTLNGAAGETWEAMRSVLRFEGMEDEAINRGYRDLIELLRDLDPAVRFRIGNSLWYREGWRPEEDFISVARSVFDAEVEGLDFFRPAASERINRWVRDATDGRIEEIVEDPIDPTTILFLINAIDFEGEWRERFDPERTRKADFRNRDGSTGTVSLMSRQGEVRFLSRPELSAVELPYGGGAFAMTVVLPGPGRDLDEVAGLLPGLWNELGEEFREATLLVEIPKFRMEWEEELNEVLSELGMGDAFSPARADFSRMYRNARNEGIHIKKVKQKSFVEVDERGTQASAVTKVEIGRVSMPPAFTADRPFFFAIRERLSGSILFLGAVVAAPEDPA